MQSIRIGSNQAGQRLDKFLHKYLPLAGSGFLYKMLRRKNITLNGKKAQGSEILALDDEVCCFFSDETFAKFSGQEKDPLFSADEGSISPEKKGFLQEGLQAYEQIKGVSILYEDADFLILNKPAGVLSQKAGPEDVSLNEWMIGYLLTADPAGKERFTAFRPGVCNRLDRNTSGIVLCGKSLAGLQYLSECIRKRKIRKFYRTICVGSLKEPMILNGYLRKDSRQNKVTILWQPMEEMHSMENIHSHEIPAGDIDSEMEYSPIYTAYSPLAVKAGYTLLEVELITGKPHQIRAHLASIGHPLIGDSKYGQKQINRKMKEKYALRHQLLHACRVEFPHADDGIGKHLSDKCISAPCPGIFAEIQEDIFFMY